MSIAKRLKAARKALGKVTQAEIANQMDMSRTTMVAIERGERVVKSHELHLLSRIYGVSIEWILTGEPQAGDPGYTERFSKDRKCDFVYSFHAVSERHHAAMVANGFWDNGGNDFATTCMLWVTEIAELFEDRRSGKTHSDKIPDFTIEEEEAADLILRIMDMAAGKNWRVAEALLAKMEYNATRPYKHGKKF